VRNVSVWFAMAITLVDAVTFIAAMPLFFKAGPGQRASRRTLFASIAIGLVAIVTTLATRETVGRWPLLIGGLLGIGAQALFWAAVGAHGIHRPSGAFAITAPNWITRRGPYRWVRHPFYIAYAMAFVAGAVFAQSRWLWVVPAWMVTMYVFAARQEERLIMSSPLAPSYTEYRGEVGALLPRLRHRVGLLTIQRDARKREATPSGRWTPPD